MTILSASHLTKRFTTGFWPFTKTQTFTIVNDISFSINKNEIVGFLGPNGAGKTTTIQMLLGTLTPSQGTLNYFGKDFAHHRVELLRKIGYASGYDKLPAQLTVYENLDVIARIYGLAQPHRAQQIAILLEAFRITNLRNRKAGTLSAGQSTRVMLAKAFIANPELILLDEPTASLDPDVAYEVREFILKQQIERGISMLITSHNMEEVAQLCDRVLVLKNGSIIANDSPEKLAQSVTHVKLHIIITENLEYTSTLLKSMSLPYTLESHNLTVSLDEHAIAPFLMSLSKHGIAYSHISIEKPTLEDYFLTIAR